MTEGSNRALVPSFILPALGLALYWTMLRATNYMDVLYPQEYTFDMFGMPMPARGVYVVPLLCYTVVGIGFHGAITRFMQGRRRCLVPVLIGCAGSCAALAAREVTDLVIIFATSAMVSLGYMFVFLLWMRFLADNPGWYQICLLCVSHLLSLFLSADVLPHWVLTAVAAVAPLASGLFWYRSVGVAKGCGANAVEPLGISRLALSLFVVFLLAGSVIRGVVNSGDAESTHWWGLSVCIMLLFTAGCFFCAPKVGGLHAKRQRSEWCSVTSFSLGSWGVLSALFFAGLFFFVGGNPCRIGSTLVTMSCALLKIVYLTLICLYVRKSSGTDVLPFLTYGLAVDVLSWSISYIAVPVYVSGISLDDGLGTGTLLSVMVFALMAAITTLCGLVIASIGVSRRGNATDSPRAQVEPKDADCFEEKDSVRVLMDRYGLTYREASVSVLYAQGYSLSKVSDKLGMSMGAAQSHIKGAYRKLNVHSKNELVETMADLPKTVGTREKS